MSNLGRNSLFVSQVTTIDNFNIYDLYHDVDCGKFDLAIEKTFSLIKLDIYNERQRLKLWEIRLLLLVFTDQLSVAKREAINVNNALYLLENVGNSNTIYPLPKNNAHISNEMLLLLLKLKSLPNLSLVNELYKLTYQARLKSTDVKSTTMLLQNISFYVCFILQITNNHLSLRSYVSSLKHQSKGLYHSNVTFLTIIVELMLGHKNSDSIVTKYQDDYDNLDEFTINSLKYVFQTIPPNINDSNLLSDESINKPTLELLDLANLVKKKDITSRILGCLLGLWDLHANYHFKLITDNGKLSFVGKDLSNNDVERMVETDDILDAILQLLNNNWCKYIHKVYGLE